MIPASFPYGSFRLLYLLAQLPGIGLPVGDRPPGDARLDGSPRHGRGYGGEQPRVGGLGNEVSASEFELLEVVVPEYGFRNRLARHCEYFFKGKDVAVQGGGNTALEDAEVLAGICKSVTLIHRRDEFRGEQHQVERLRKLPNLQFRLHSTITALQGDNALQAVVIKDLQTGQEEPLAVDGLFVAIGQIPQNEAFRGLVELDERGYVVAGEDCRTSTPGVFAAGDGRTKAVRQLVTAASDGATAALAAAEYIRSV